MAKEHQYKTTVQWTGNSGAGTVSYTSYERSHLIRSGSKPLLLGSSDPSFRGDPEKHNPEELLLASIAACHMLWYLHLCSEAGVVVMAYEDCATGTMQEAFNGSGRFTEVVLHPVVKVAEPSMVELANALHQKANALCYIANSLNFKVHHRPRAAAL